jgi:hypothetical protein
MMDGARHVVKIPRMTWHLVGATLLNSILAKMSKLTPNNSGFKPFCCFIVVPSPFVSHCGQKQKQEEEKRRRFNGHSRHHRFGSISRYFTFISSFTASDIITINFVLFMIETLWLFATMDTSESRAKIMVVGASNL